MKKDHAYQKMDQKREMRNEKRNLGQTEVLKYNNNNNNRTIYMLR